MKYFHQKLLISFFFIFLFNTAKSQSFSHLVYEANKSQYFGAANIPFIHKAIYTFEEKYLPDTLFSEKTFLRKTGGIGYRLSKLFFLDLQTDRYLSLVQHEVFGHGARYREFGHRENTYNMNLFFPFGTGGGFARSGPVESGFIISADERIMKTIGGSEGNLVLGNVLASEMLLEKSIHYRDALLYLNSHNDLLGYIWYTRYLDSQNDIPSSNDMSSYIFEMNSRYSGITENYDIKKLSRQSLMSLLNPLRLYSAFTIGYTYLVKGKPRLTKIPMIQIGKISYLPMIIYKLTPWGTEFQMILNLMSEKRVLSIEAGMSDGTFKKYYSGGFKIFNLWNTDRFNMNFQLNAWHQPELNLENPSFEENENILGAMLKTEIHFAPLKNYSNSRFYLQTGFKTKGYAVGEPLAETILLRFGLSFKL